MHIVIFGLTISSSWGNGHATLWRSLVKAMLRRNHTVSFYEHDTAYYRAERDLSSLPEGGRLVLYSEMEQIRQSAQQDLDRADFAMCTSFCPDGPSASALILNSKARIKAFYDLDTPVTLTGLDAGKPVDYLPRDGLSHFDVVLSYTGGRAVHELHSRLGARYAVPLYGSVDPDNHYPVVPRHDLMAYLSYLGTYAEDRQNALSELLLKPAARLQKERFLIGGAQYPDHFPWRENVAFVRHVPPSLHPAFFSSCRATLNVTRGVMASYGFCPSGRLFEAAACGAPILSDDWEGLDTFFVPDDEILIVKTTDDVVNALSRSDSELRRIAEAARSRALTEHTGNHRVEELEQICENLYSRQFVAS